MRLTSGRSDFASRAPMRRCLWVAIWGAVVATVVADPPRRITKSKQLPAIARKVFVGANGVANYAKMIKEAEAAMRDGSPVVYDPA